MEYYLDDIEYCECIGQFNDEYVYDIEMDDETHTFIGNDILVHNSLYISFTPLMQSCGYEGDELKFILHLNAIHIKSLFKNFLIEYASKYNVKSIHDFELETINKSALHIKKKHYINNVVWEDGVFHEDLSYFYPKGIEIVKSSTPLFVRDNIWDFIKYMFKNPGNLDIKEILKIIKDVKKQFMLADIEDISMTTSCTNYENKVIDDQNTLECVKGAHFSIKAAAFHNYLLNQNDQFKTKYDLIRGGKIKYYFIKHDMNDRFAYLRNFHPYEITEAEGIEIDYDEQFNKTFLSIVNRFIDPVGLPFINKRLSVLNSIFSSKTHGKTKKPVIVEEDGDEDKIEILYSDDAQVNEVDELLIDEMYCVNEIELDDEEITFNDYKIIKPVKEVNTVDDFWDF